MLTKLKKDLITQSKNHLMSFVDHLMADYCDFLDCKQSVVKYIQIYNKCYFRESKVIDSTCVEKTYWV